MTCLQQRVDAWFLHLHGISWLPTSAILSVTMGCVGAVSAGVANWQYGTISLAPEAGLGHQASECLAPKLEATRDMVTSRVDLVNTRNH